MECTHILLQVMDLDRKVKRGRERLAQEVEVTTPPIPSDKYEQLKVIEEKIKKLLEQIETLGEAGKVDEAEALMRKVNVFTRIFYSVYNNFVQTTEYSFGNNGCL